GGSGSEAIAWSWAQRPSALAGTANPVCPYRFESGESRTGADLLQFGGPPAGTSVGAGVRGLLRGRRLSRPAGGSGRTGVANLRGPRPDRGGDRAAASRPPLRPALPRLGARCPTDRRCPGGRTQAPVRRPVARRNRGRPGPLLSQQGSVSHRPA